MLNYCFLGPSIGYIIKILIFGAFISAFFVSGLSISFKIEISSSETLYIHQSEDSKPILSDFSMGAVTNCISAFFGLFFMDDPKFRKFSIVKSCKDHSLKISAQSGEN